MGLKKDRPKITRSNFICAEPMPGEEQMLLRFEEAHRLARSIQGSCRLPSSRRKRITCCGITWPPPWTV